MFNIIVVCTGNICRSPMAAGLLAHYLPDDLSQRIAVSSAGTHGLVGYPAEPFAIEAMAEIGIDISDHRARRIDRAMARDADLILAMTTEHCRVVKQLIRWRQHPPRMISEFDTQSATHDIADPYGEPLQSYRNCIRTLRPCIKGVIFWLANNL